MDAATRALFTSALKSEIFTWLGEQESDAVDLNGFENFVFGTGQDVYRITWEGHRSHDQLAAELEFLDYLQQAGAPAIKPRTLPDGSLLKRFGEFHVARFEQVHGESPCTESGYTPGVIRQWGRSIGQFHQLASQFDPVHQRGDWRTDENHQFDKRIPAEQAQVLVAAQTLMSDLSNLPVSTGTYGLIHSDAHVGNFLVHKGGLTFFDFDDCLYTWFAYDVATILFGAALQPWVPRDQQKIAGEIERFLDEFLAGYAETHDTAALMLEHMPVFLKLRELSLYAVIHAFMDMDELGWYASRFMEGRQARIEMQVPYLESVAFERFR